LGGARPKAAVTDSTGQLFIAKFPHAEDEYSMERWSFLALTLAKQAGIKAPGAALSKWMAKRVARRAFRPPRDQADSIFVSHEHARRR